MPDVIVLPTEGKWYCKNYGYGDWETTTKINGAVVTLCPDAKWCWIPEEPKTIEKLVPERTKTLGHKLKGEVTIPSLNPLVDPYFFRYLDDGGMNNQALREYYEEVVEVTPAYYEEYPCNFIVIHLDAEPVTFDFPVRVKHPAAFAEYKEVHHLYPCEVTSESLFLHLYYKVKARVGGSRNLKMNDHFSLKSFDVSRRVLLATSKTVKQDVSGLFSKKPKYKNVVKTEEWEKVLDLYGGTYEYGERVPSYNAPNYAELKAKVDKYVAEQLAKLDDVLHQHCPHCAGSGRIIREETHVTA